MKQSFPTFVKSRFGGKLYSGAHNPNGRACFHEALNVYQGKEWSDDTSGTLDLIALNDAPWSSDEARTKAMVPLGSLVLEWPSWTDARRQKWAKYVAEQTIRRILPPTLRRVAELVPEKAPELVAAALRCETEGTGSAAEAARAAARAAAWSAAWSAAAAARAAAEAARAAARAAAEAARAAAREAARAAAWSAAWSAAAEAAARSAAWSAAADAPLKELAKIMLEASRLA